MNIENIHLPLLGHNTRQRFSLEDYPAKGYVITFMSAECPVCVSYVPALTALKDTFGRDSILFISVFRENTDKVQDILTFTGNPSMFSHYNVLDNNRKLQQELHATITPEVFVLDRNFSVIYSGKIDNRMEALGVKRQLITEFYLRDALNSLLENEAPRVPHTKAVGCFIE